MVGSIFHKTINGSSPKKVLKKAKLFLFGVNDLHMHIRWGTIKKYIDPLEPTIEIGAAKGVITYQFYLTTKQSITGISYLQSEIDEANQNREKIGIKEVVFKKGDLLKLNNIPENHYNQCLLIDVLEHVDNDSRALININKILKLNGTLIISVPTPNYPNNFSREFADLIGHKIDGYWIDDLRPKLSDFGFGIREWNYYTCNLSSWLCSLWYRKIRNKKILRELITPLFIFLSLFDNLSGKNNCSSLAIKAIKVRSI